MVVDSMFVWPERFPMEKYSQWGSPVVYPVTSFLCLILNDLPSINLPPTYQLNIYSVDVSVYSGNTSLDCLQTGFQTILHQIKTLMAINKMNINASKTYVVWILSKNEKEKHSILTQWLCNPPQRHYYIYPSLIIDSHLNWSNHTDYILKKARSCINAILR